MVIEKVLNNNVVVSKNELGEEIICMGKGIAFQKKPGDHISKNDVQKEFIFKGFFCYPPVPTIDGGCAARGSRTSEIHC